jgi:hypothetical protein
MSTHIVNVSGQTVMLYQGGQLACKIPDGFSSQLGLDGNYTASTGTATTVNETVSNTTGPAQNGEAKVTVSNLSTGGPIAVYSPNGSSSDGWLVGAQGQLHSGNNFTTQAELPATPNWGAALLTIEDNTGGPLIATWTQQALSTTNYTTNVSGGVNLGDFTISAGVRQVVLMPGTLTVETYAPHIDFFLAGFALAFCVECMRVVYQVILGVVSESD